MISRRVEIAGAAVTLAASVGIWFATAGFPPEARMVPWIVIGTMIVSAAIWLVNAIRMPAEAELPTADEDYREASSPATTTGSMIALLAAAFALTILYALAVIWAGLFLPTLVYVPTMAALLGFRRWLITVPATIVYAIGIYAVFVLIFERPLPLY